MSTEVMPELFEGDLMYMPTTLPGLSIGKARELLQQADRLIYQIPEVESVFGKIGRAETATDPAPLTMIETLIQLKPRDQWRSGLTVDLLKKELNEKVNFPGLTNAWIMPIKTRIDMLSTGIKTPVGVKVSGPELAEIQRIGKEVETLLKTLPGTRSAYSERVTGGRYIDIKPKRRELARYAVSIDDLNELVSVAIGGKNISYTVEGNERYPINIRFPRELREDVSALKNLPIISTKGAQIPLSLVADISIVDGAPFLKSENARLSGWTFVDLNDVDLGSYVQRASALVKNQVSLPPGYSISWSGQYEHLLRAEKRFRQLIPLTILVIFSLLFLIFERTSEALLVMLTLPLALVGAIWLIFLLGYNFSVAIAVGLIALSGIAIEFGVVMLLYLNSSIKRFQKENQALTTTRLRQAVIEGAVMPIRPKAMTVAVVVIGLMPLMLSTGTASEVMKRIAAPVVGGMITAPLLSLFLIPLIFYLQKRSRLEKFQ